MDFSERWKATECRIFLLYVAPVILQKVIPDALYKHFMLLACRMLLVTSADRSNDAAAAEFLKIFSDHFQFLYGEEWVTYTVHNIVHLIEDVRTIGNVD